MKSSRLPAIISFELSTRNVVLWHCSDDTFTICHTHPYFSTTGASDSFVVSDHGDFTYFVITLTATDSGGLQASKSITLTPNRVAISFASNPAGATISVDSTTQTAPFTHSVPRKSAHVIYANSPQTLGGTAMQFSSWSDAGANPHTIIATADATYTVALSAAGTPTPTPTNTATATPTFTPTAGTPVIGVGGIGRPPDLTALPRAPHRSRTPLAAIAGLLAVAVLATVAGAVAWRRTRPGRD